MSTPSTMELLRDVSERPIECDTCGLDRPADQISEVRSRTPAGKVYYEKQCSACAEVEAAEKAMDTRAAADLAIELRALAGKCPGMSRDDLYEALQVMSLGVLAA